MVLLGLHITIYIATRLVMSRGSFRGDSTCDCEEVNVSVIRYRLLENSLR